MKCKHNVVDLENSTLSYIDDSRKGNGYICKVCKVVYLILLINRDNKKTKEWNKDD